MLGNFDKVFEEMMHKRIYGIEEFMLKDTEYKELSDKSNKLFRKIEELLPEEYQDLIFSFEEINSLQDNLIKKMIYEQGLKDGVELKNILKLVI